MKTILVIILFYLVVAPVYAETPCYELQKAGLAIGCDEDIGDGVTVTGLDCVPEKEMLEAWGDALSYMPSDSMYGVQSFTAECDPCRCPTSSSGCYEYMAKKEKAKEQRRKEALELFEKAKKYGICK